MSGPLADIAWALLARPPVDVLGLRVFFEHLFYTRVGDIGIRSRREAVATPTIAAATIAAAKTAKTATRSAAQSTATQLQLGCLPSKGLKLPPRQTERDGQAHAILDLRACGLVATPFAAHRLSQFHAEHVPDEAAHLQALTLGIAADREGLACAIAHRNAACQKLGDDEDEGLVCICLLTLREVLFSRYQACYVRCSDGSPAALCLVNLVEEPRNFSQPLLRVHRSAILEERLRCRHGLSKTLSQHRCMQQALQHGIEIASVRQVLQANRGRLDTHGAATQKAHLADPLPVSTPAKRSHPRPGILGNDGGR
mmetsp:Transcript_2792/g.6962  ORF Transcript_2792/g.6962 Transcript_2792/m.6962 type:complete len:312 (+) Transcript_2792:1036-1971(+)